ncbi:MAG: hypothetical protein IJO50_01940 [Clostridia bacterium]|nr:hypothetical protein [Clostridia bacterium]
MIEQDTIKLLRECDAGIKMGVTSIDDVIGYVHSGEMKEALVRSKENHERIRDKLQKQLQSYEDEGKDPNPVAKGMSWMKTNMKLMMDESDHTVADLMTDGCNMGVKSLSRYLNQYKAADENSKNITKSLILLEEQLAIDLRPYL